MKPMFILLAATAAALAAPSAQAAPVVTAVGANLSTGPYSFSFLGNAFTFAATGDIFNPLAVQNQASSATASFGGFLGVPLAPTSSFTNRGTVTFGPSNNFATFTALTTVPFSNGDNFIGLRATVAGQNYFGFAYTTNTMLNSFGFENVAGATITATTLIPAVPEAGTWAMMIVGVGAVGATLRRRRKVSTRVSFA